jgi:predicted DNA-binding transcriptional regulator AlpA
MQQLVRLVDVPCVPQAKTATGTTVCVRGMLHTIPERFVSRTDADRVTVPEWYAHEHHLLTADRCLTVDDLARRFGASKAWVYRNLPKLEADGFPKPVLSWGAKRWDPASVSNWIASRARRGEMPVRPMTAPAPAPQDHDLAAARSRLAEAYGA